MKEDNGLGRGDSASAFANIIGIISSYKEHYQRPFTLRNGLCCTN